ALKTGWGQVGPCRLGPGLGLLLVVGGRGDVTGQDALTRPIHTRLRVAAVIPALVVAPHDRPRGLRKVALGLVVGALLHRFRGFASPWRARPPPLRLGFGSPLPRPSPPPVSGLSLPGACPPPAAAPRLRLAAATPPPLPPWPAPPSVA